VIRCPEETSIKSAKVPTNTVTNTKKPEVIYDSTSGNITIKFGEVP